jgi:hypothetical protein
LKGGREIADEAIRKN